MIRALWDGKRLRGEGEHFSPDGAFIHTLPADRRPRRLTPTLCEVARSERAQRSGCDEGPPERPLHDLLDEIDQCGPGQLGWSFDPWHGLLFGWKCPEFPAEFGPPNA